MKQALYWLKTATSKGLDIYPMKTERKDIEEWKEAIEYMPPNPELNQIILQWLEKHPNSKRIYF